MGQPVEVRVLFRPPFFMNTPAPITFATNLAKDAGAIMRENFTHGMNKTWKGDGTPLTVTDTTIDELLRTSVKSGFPEHGIISEEGSDVNRGCEHVWVCDPVDGTIPFSHGVPTAVFSLALVRDGKPILGVIYDPFMDRMFTAEQGKGTHLNTAPIHVSESDGFVQKIFGAVLWPGVVETLYPLIEAVVRRGAQHFNCGSIAYMGALVATGDLVSSAFIGTSPWDIAAVKVIVEEAGGKVTDIEGNEQRYDRPINGAIISNGKLHDEVVRMIG